jgi:hypothetical protein
VTAAITIPYRPRPFQKVIHAGMETHRWGAVVCHRRFGKTVCAVNHLQKCAMRATRERPRFAYIAPTYKQAKAVTWDYVKHFAQPVLDHDVNESELRVDFAQNASQVRLFGADNPDSLRGMYFDGVVLDEYGLMPPKTFSEVVRPMLSDRGGWALFMGTPNGKNQFYNVVQQARDDPDWFFAEYKASQTGVLSAEELASARQVMTADEYQQEYECSFEASVKGAIYARELIQAREQGRMTRIPYDPAVLVDTDWDLGFGDLTAVWFSQTFPTGEVRLIDYAEAAEGLPYFVSLLRGKGYAYGDHWAPHDIALKEMSGNSRLQASRQLGLNFLISPKVERIEDGIHAVRMLLPRCWFEADRCRDGLEALHNYRWKVPNVQDPTGRPLPVHDWASHGSDAFRGLAYRHYVKRRRPQEDLRRLQIDHDPDDRITSGRHIGRRIGIAGRVGRRGGY